MDWIRCSDRLPESGVPVLAVASGWVPYVIRAIYAAKLTLVAHQDCDVRCCDYDEATDEYYTPVGWYECNENEDCHWSVDGPVTHWMSLPAQPAEVPE